MPPRGHFQPLMERWQAMVEPDAAGCWLWTGYVNASGYGVIRMRQPGSTLAHRIGYELHRGPIPDGLQLDHLCRVRRCVNPDHLEPVTNRENVRRGNRTGRTHCPKGHPYDEANTEWTARRYGPVRVCKACHADSGRRYQASLPTEVKRAKWRAAWRRKQERLHGLSS